MWSSLRTTNFIISLVLIALLLWHFAGVRLYAQSRSIQSQQAAEAARRAPLRALEESQFDALLAELKNVVKQGAERSKVAPERGFATIDKLSALKAKLIAENAKNENYFSQLEGTIKAKGLTAEILIRHQEFVRAYETKYQTLLANLESIESAHKDATGLWGKITGKNKQIEWDGPVNKTLSFLEENTPRPPKHNFDPHNLPHRSLKADKPILPKLTREQWEKALSTDFADYADSKNAARSSVQESSVLKRGNAGQPLQSLKPLGTAPPTPADLAETIEVKFTPEIRQLADSLGRNPVKIFNWVRNNIEFVPTWGSIQGAQMCLESRSCNSFDTSSLLIALFRVSGIPARYQMGTIEVQAENARNWLGGFSDTRAAARFAASGGVPSAGTVEQGGALRSIRMEHVWVRAFVDYAPSQGVINRAGDTWAELDSSFKLYQHSPEANLEAAVNLDVTAFNDHLRTSSTINESESSVTNIDHTFIEAALTQSVGNIANTFPGANPETLLPARTLIVKELPVLPSGTAYKILSRGQALAALPEQLRHALTVSVTGESGQALLTFRTSLPELAAKDLTVSYEFATEADANLVRAIVPSEFRDQITPAKHHQILAAIPAHLVHVRPVIILDAVTLLRGDPTGMGATQRIVIHFDAPTVTTVDDTLDAIAWGDYGVTLDLVGISASAFHQRIVRFQTRAQQYQGPGGQQGANIAPVVTSRHDLIRSAWFFAVNQRAVLLSKTHGLRYTCYPSLAFSFINYRIASILGVPQGVAEDNYVLDAARQLHVVTALDGNQQRESDFSVALGFTSSLLEGKVLAQILSGAWPASGGNSAANALLAASGQHIPVHVLNAANAATLLPRIDDRYPKGEIADAVNAGRVVFVPQHPPTIEGAPVIGYVTIDPGTGDGAYLVGRAHGATFGIMCRPDLTPAEYADCQRTIALGEFWYAITIIITLVAVFVLSIGLIVAAAEALEAVTLLTVLGLTGAILAHVAIDLQIARYADCLRQNTSEQCTTLLLAVVLKALGLDDILELAGP